MTTADELAAIWPTRTADDGTRETWDPNAGVWRNDADLVAQHDARTAKRRLLGETWADGDPNARAMNEAGL